MGNLLLALILALLYLCSASAQEAAEPVYGSTRAFAAVLQEAGIPYEARGVDAAKEDSLTIVQGDCSIRCFFTADGSNVSFVVWYLISYDPADEAAVMQVCNGLNARSDGPRVFADPSDCTVTIMLDVPLPIDAAGQVAYVGYRCVSSMLPEALEALAPYDLSRPADDAAQTPTETPVPTVTPAPTATPDSAAVPSYTATPSPTATSEPIEAASPQRVVVTAASARVRSGPGVNSPYLCMVRAGEIFPVIGMRDGWYIITIDGRTGFLSMSVADPMQP